MSDRVWQRVVGVTCVVCPSCGFTFDADHHEDARGGYSCPSCGEKRARDALADWKRGAIESEKRGQKHERALSSALQGETEPEQVESLGKCFICGEPAAARRLDGLGICGEHWYAITSNRSVPAPTASEGREHDA